MKIKKRILIAILIFSIIIFEFFSNTSIILAATATNTTQEENPADLGGVLLEPIISFINVIADSIQSFTTFSMTNEMGWRDVLVGKRLYSEYREIEDNGIRTTLNDIGDGETARHIIWYQDNNNNEQYDANEDNIIMDIQASANQTDVEWNDSLPSIEEAIDGNEVFTKSTELISGADVRDDDASIENNAFFVNATGFENEYRYPQITYSPEEIFSGDIELLNANFFNAENINEESAFYIIRNIVIFWFRALRYLGLAGLLSILIYTGIKIMTSSASQDKAKYKERVVNWLLALFIMLLLPYAMSLMTTVVDSVVNLFNTGDLSNTITVYAIDALAGNRGETETEIMEQIEEDESYALSPSWHRQNYTYTKFTTNLMGLVRFQSQSRNLTKKIGNEILYIMLIIFTVKFTIIYLKRMLYIAFLTIISPLVAMMYPIDKMAGGKSRSFEMWIKEYVFNLVLQPIHMLIYYVFIASVMGFASENILYVLVVYALMTQVEKILRQISVLGGIPDGVVGGTIGANNISTNGISSSISSVRHILGIRNRENLIESDGGIKKEEIEKSRNRMDLAKYLNMNNETLKPINEVSTNERELLITTNNIKNASENSRNVNTIIEEDTADGVSGLYGISRNRNNNQNNNDENIRFLGNNKSDNIILTGNELSRNYENELSRNYRNEVSRNYENALDTEVLREEQIFSGNGNLKNEVQTDIYEINNNNKIREYLEGDLSDYEIIKYNNLIDNGMKEEDAIKQIIKERNKYLNNNLKEIQEKIRYVAKRETMFKMKEIMKNRQNLIFNITGKKTIKGIANNIINKIKKENMFKRNLNSLFGINSEKLNSSIEKDRKYNPLEGIRFFAGMSLGSSGKDNKEEDNEKEPENSEKETQEDLFLKEQRILEFLENEENLKAYQEKYGDLGEEKLSIEFARGARLAGKGVTDLNEQMQVAAYTDSMVEDLFNSKFNNCTDEEIHSISEKIRENARKNGDKNLEKLPDKDIIKVSLRNAKTTKDGISMEDLAIKTLKAKKEIGDAIINGNKEKQELWINEISLGDRKIADSIRKAIESSKKMNIATKTDKYRQNALREEYRRTMKK